MRSHAASSDAKIVVFPHLGPTPCSQAHGCNQAVSRKNEIAARTSELEWTLGIRRTNGMIVASPSSVNRSRKTILGVSLWFALIACALPLQADEPYSRTRDYDLQHSKIALRFDLDQRKVIGDV